MTRALVVAVIVALVSLGAATAAPFSATVVPHSMSISRISPMQLQRVDRHVIGGPRELDLAARTARSVPRRRRPQG